MTKTQTLFSAFVMVLAVSTPGTSDADNLGQCRDGVCNRPGVSCDDTCTYDGAQSGSTSCEALNSSCIRCGTANYDELIGKHTNFFVYETKLRDVYWECSDGTKQFIRHECVHEIVGIDICWPEACQNWGQNGCD